MADKVHRKGGTGLDRDDPKIKALRKRSQEPEKVRGVRLKKGETVLEGAKTLLNPFYGINPKLSEVTPDPEAEHRKYVG